MKEFFSEELSTYLCGSPSTGLRDAKSIPELVKTNVEARYHYELSAIARMIQFEHARIRRSNLRLLDFSIKLGNVLQCTRETLMNLHFEFKPCTVENILLLPNNYEKLFKEAENFPKTCTLLPGDAAFIAKDIEEHFDDSHDGYMKAVTSLIEYTIPNLCYAANMNITWKYPVPDSVLMELTTHNYHAWVDSGHMPPQCTHIRLN